MGLPLRRIAPVKQRQLAVGAAHADLFDAKQRLIVLCDHRLGNFPLRQPPPLEVQRHAAHAAHGVGSSARRSTSRRAEPPSLDFRATSTSVRPAQGRIESIRLHSHTVLSKILSVTLLIWTL